MIDLYGMASPNVFKVVLMLEEAELPYRFRHVNVMAGDQYEPAFQAMNPNGRVPVIVDPDGPGGAPFTVFESGAILIYLAEKTGKLLPADMRGRHTVLQWLMFQMGGIGPMSGQFVHFSRAVPADSSEYARHRYFTETQRLYGVLDRRLADAAYMAGDDYSIADVATWPWARNHEMLKLDFKVHSNLARWVAAIAARPAAQRMEAKQAEMMPLDAKAFQGADADRMDRFYARGKYAASISP